MPGDYCRKTSPFYKDGNCLYDGSLFFAACPGGEGAVLKTVGPKGLAGSNPVCGALGIWCNGSTRDFDSLSMGSNPVILACSIRLKDRTRDF